MGISILGMFSRSGASFAGRRGGIGYSSEQIRNTTEGSFLESLVVGYNLEVNVRYEELPRIPHVKEVQCDSPMMAIRNHPLARVRNQRDGIKNLFTLGHEGLENPKNALGMSQSSLGDFDFSKTYNGY